MTQLTATVLHVNPKVGEVFGFAADPNIAKHELDWYAAVTESCRGGQCAAGDQAQLIEIGCLDVSKLAAIGASDHEPGFLIGLRVLDSDVIEKIEAGVITEFSVDIDSDGLRVEFPEVIGKSEKGDVMEKTCKSGADKGAHTEIADVVKKAAAGEMDREQVWKFAQELAVKAKQSNETFEKALDRVMEEHGLYAAYDTAPKVAPAVVASPSGPAISKAEEPLHRMAEKLVTDSGGKITYAKAYSQVAASNPQLFQAAVG